MAIKEKEPRYDLIIEVSKHVRILVFPKEFLMEELVSVVDRQTKEKKETWQFFGSYGKIEDCLKRAIQIVVRKRLKEKVTLEEYLKETRLVSQEINQIIGGIYGK